MPGPDFWRSKPPPGVAVARGHPLAQRLVCAFPLNEGAGNPRDVIGGLVATAQSAAAVWSRGSPYGPVLDTTTCAFATPTGVPVNPLRSGTGHTLVVLFQHTSAGAGNEALVAGTFLGRTDIPAVEIRLNTNGWLLYTQAASSSNASNWSPAGGMLQQQWYLATLRMERTSGVTTIAHIRLPATRLIEQLAIPTSGTPWELNAELTLGGYRPTATTARWPGQIGGVWVWDRVLADRELQHLAAAPWQMFAPPVWRRYFIPSSGVTGTGALTIRHPALAASGTTTILGSASLTVRHPVLAATGTTTVTGTGALTIRHPLLSGTGAFVNATGALTIRHPLLSGSGTTTVTGTGALSISHPTLAASGAQGPTATGSLTIRHPLLAATGTTTVTGTAALTIRHPLLSATGTTTVTGTGSVTIGHPTLLGAAPGTVTGSATLTIRHPLLAATGTSTVTATGALTIRHPLLAATGTTTVTGTGSVTIQHPLLSGTAPTTITATGALVIRHPVLAGVGTSTIVGTGSLTIGHPVLHASDQAARDITVLVGAGTTGWAVGAGAAGWTVGGGQT